jgi:hypothetical protein
LSVTILVIAAVIGALAALYLADRLLLKMEERGWIYYRKKHGTTDRVGEAALRLQAILEPSKQYAIEEKEKTAKEEHPNGAPPTLTCGKEKRNRHATSLTAHRDSAFLTRSAQG